MRQSRNKVQGEKGFTLIEVTMAMVILGIGIMSIVALQTRDMAYNNSSRRQTEAYTWAMDRVERLRAISYTDADLIVSGTAKTDNEGPYTVRWLVSDNSAKVPDTKKVDVTVLWNNRTVSTIVITRTLSSM
ncbi:type IV pilus modification PilV family protein [Desulfobulbus rhabdoformis]|jgi:type IV pilus assembly protein PilV|uniref:type IV pilus modification PilV family protein n=1 Tax=Desulfobulbus rhabdoformis TaxID=34032 RepID=UPI0023DCEF6C|nr:prepilin-type N-terminal cleavage/methylation domain-containing protein [Desulfobulbus rhabdoformis]